MITLRPDQRLSNLAAQLSHIDPKSVSEFEHGLDAGISLAPLDQPNVIPMEVRPASELLLAKSLLLPPMA